MVLIDDLQRHEPAARIRQRDGDRPGIEVEDGRRVQRVAVDPDDDLVIDGAQLAEVEERAEAAVSDDVAEVQVGFGAGEVVG